MDTGGFEPVAKTGIVAEMAKQTKQAVAESDIIIFLTAGAAWGMALASLALRWALRFSNAMKFWLAFLCLLAATIAVNLLPKSMPLVTIPPKPIA